jgi:tRNA G18 (ribose-2'-O)-methylase SpoU
MKEADDKWFLWQRNVVEKYKDMPTEDIKADLKKNALPIGVLVANVEGDFNLGSIMRSSNFFGASQFFYFGSKRFDRRSSVGVQHYFDLVHLSTIDEVKELKHHYVFVGLENNIPKTELLNDFVWAPVPLLIVGEENVGIPKEILELCDHVVEIPNHGSVRSLNAASAASIAMYDYVNKNRDHTAKLRNV